MLIASETRWATVVIGRRVIEQGFKSSDCPHQGIPLWGKTRVSGFWGKVTGPINLQ